MRYIIFLLITLSSCSTVSKVFNKHKEKTDSTSHTVEQSNVNQVEDSTHLVKSESESETEIVIEFGDSGIYAPFKPLSDLGIYYYPKQDYFFELEGVKTNRPVKSVKIKSRSNVFNYDSFSNHSQLQADTFKEAKTKVKSEVKDTVKVKKVSRLPFWCWLLLLIIPCYFIGRYIRLKWPQIKSFIIHKTTGL